MTIYKLIHTPETQSSFEGTEDELLERVHITHETIEDCTNPNNNGIITWYLSTPEIFSIVEEIDGITYRQATPEKYLKRTHTITVEKCEALVQQLNSGEISFDDLL